MFLFLQATSQAIVITLEQARKNYDEYGACEKEMLVYVRRQKKMK